MFGLVVLFPCELCVLFQKSFLHDTSLHFIYFSSKLFCLKLHLALCTQTPTEGSHGSKLGSQAVIEYGKSANFNTNDLQSFFKQLNPEQLGETCGVAYGDNNGDIRASVEANLDVQYIMATGQFVNTTTYKIAEPGVGIEDQMLDYTYIVGNQTQPALVHRYVDYSVCMNWCDMKVPIFNLPVPFLTFLTCILVFT